MQLSLGASASTTIVGRLEEDDIEGLVLEGERRHIGCVQLDTLGHSATAFRYVALTRQSSAARAASNEGERVASCGVTSRGRSVPASSCGSSLSRLRVLR